MGGLRPCRCPAPEHGLASTAPSPDAGQLASTAVDDDPRPDAVDKQRPGIWRLPGWGCSMPSAWCSVWSVGWLIDRALGTLPLFLFLGLIVGIAMGVLATRAEWKRYF